MTSVTTSLIDGLTSSVAIKAPVKVATTANITLEGTQTIDGVAVSADDRVLVKNQTDTTENGIYVVSTGSWTRAKDFDGSRDCVTGTIVGVQQGTTNANTYYRVSTAGDPSPGDAMAFAESGLQGEQGETGPQGPAGADGTVDITTLDAETTVDLTNDLLLMYDATDAGNNKVTPQAFMNAVMSSLTAETAPATDDTVAIYDTSGTAADKMTLANLLKVVNSLTADGSPDASSDYILTYDASASAVKKVLLQTAANTASINTNNIVDDAVTLAKMAAGTADRLLGFDASGAPSEITAGSNITISSGVISASASGLTSVSQGDLNTSTGTLAAAVADAWTLLGTLPGGQYGFGLEGKTAVSGREASLAYGTPNSGTSFGHVAYAFGGAETSTITVQERYVTASPPFDMGDGDASGFIFVRLNRQGAVLGMYAADVPPWGYNGPTNIRADKKDAQGRKYRKCFKVRSARGLQDISEIVGRDVLSLAELTAAEMRSLSDYDLDEQYELITQDIKNRDMALLPHPFVGAAAANETVVLLDPMASITRRIIAMMNAGADVSELIRDQLAIDNEPLNRKGPKGVMQAKFRLK